MNKITKKLIELSQGHLQPGEELLVGLRINLKGTAFGVGLQALGSVGGTIWGSEVIKEGEE
ncbi:MAG: hypothetical protein IIA45_03515 [Bacteroidetes bacterium]|nr:hypothetical protein [Bacteroidota bacterium]